ncbi:tyrosine--tRNA ligase [Myxococcota bacterium]|nr:tyrosine--tRNA ligase [Myxococcota bacterium]
MTRTVIPPAEEQLAVLTRGTVDLHPHADLEARLKKSHAEQKPLVIKAGFDPTAPDLHFGHTVLIEKMAQFQRFGHDVVFLIGDYTALIGDPTGRNTLRPPLSKAEIEKNASTYTEQVFKILDREKTRIEWNSRWLDKLSFNDVIVLASKYNLGRMLERRDFKQRFEANTQISLHELLYPLMQGYDSVALECDVELGGHDQIFNLNVGRHLMEEYGKKPQIVMTVGLLVGLDGVEKMSKSKGNHVGITDAADDMFGKVMSTSDATMMGWWDLLTDRRPPVSEAGIVEPLAAKKALARLMVQRFHGEAAAADTAAWWDAGRPPRNVDEVEVPSALLPKLLVGAGLASSNNDARRKVEQGGVAVDGARITSPSHVVPPGTYLVTVGKTSAKRVKVVAPSP